MRALRQIPFLAGDRYPWIEPHPVTEVLKIGDQTIERPLYEDVARTKPLINPGSREHYTEFAKGGVQAYIHYLKELNGAFYTDPYRQAVLSNPNGAKLPEDACKNLAHEWGGKALSPTGKELNTFTSSVRNAPETAHTIQQVAHDTQPALGSDLPINKPTAIDSVPGTPPIKEQLYNHNNYTPLGNAQGFHDIIRGYADQYARDNFGGKALDALSPQENTDLMKGLDDFIKRHDPDVWRQKQWADTALGMFGQQQVGGYSTLGHVALGLRNLGIAMGVPMTAAGVALLGKYLWNKLHKKSMSKESAELAHNGSVRVPKDLIAHIFSQHDKTRNRVMPYTSGRKMTKSAFLGFGEEKKRKTGFDWSPIAAAGLLGGAALYNQHHAANIAPTPQTPVIPPTTPAPAATQPIIQPTTQPTTRPTTQPTTAPSPIGESSISDAGHWGMRSALIKNVVNGGAWVANKLGKEVPTKPISYLASKAPGVGGLLGRAAPLATKAIPVANEAMYWSNDPQKGLENSYQRQFSLLPNKDELHSQQYIAEHPVKGRLLNGLTYVTKPLDNPASYGVAGLALNTAHDFIDEGRLAYRSGGYGPLVDKALNTMPGDTPMKSPIANIQAAMITGKELSNPDTTLGQAVTDAAAGGLGADPEEVYKLRFGDPKTQALHANTALNESLWKNYPGAKGVFDYRVDDTGARFLRDLRTGTTFQPNATYLQKFNLNPELRASIMERMKSALPDTYNQIMGANL
jgi:hypothetical protein